MPARNDLTGQRFGCWLVERELPRNSNKQTVWLCHCDCGTERGVRAGDLVQGKSLNCGCRRPAAVRSKLLTHGQSRRGSPRHYLLTLHTNIFRRCYDPTCDKYRYYGGRGITVWQGWKDCAVFIADIISLIGDRPSPSYSIDRIDNDGNYEPGNIRWATQSQQIRNRRPSPHSPGQRSDLQRAGVKV